MNTRVIHRNRLFVWITLILLAFISACTNQRNPGTSQSPAVITPTNTQSPTQIPSSTVTAASPDLSDRLNIHTPTPIATPEEPRSQYILKDWVDEDALDIIKTLDQYSAAVNISGPGPNSDFGYYLAQKPVRIAAMEFLARFSNSPLENDVRWRLALADSLLSTKSSDRWIVAQVERYLNAGLVQMDSLDQAMAPHGFQIKSLVSDPTAYVFLCGGDVSPLNISGLIDHSEVQIIIVHAIEQDVGLVIAVVREQSGNYRVIPIHSGDVVWGNGVCQTISAQDVTGDGKPEIIVSEGFASGSMQRDDVYIYQWKQDQFINVFQTTIFDFPYSVSFSTGFDASTSIRMEYDYDLYRFIDTWNWAQDKFTYASKQVIFPFKLEEIYNDVIHVAMETGQYTDLEQQLSQMEYPVELEEQIGSALKDYLTFELAMSQALLFRYEDARATLQTLIESPAHTELEVIPTSACKFLDFYHSKNDLYKGCVAAQTYYQDFLAQAVPKNGQSIPSKSIPEGYFGPLTLCNPHIMFAEMVNSLAYASPENVLAELNRYGVKFLYQEAVDLNDDGELDWLLVPDYQEDDYSFLWLFIKQDGIYQVDFVPFLVNGEFSPLHSRLIHLPKDEHPSLLINVGDELRLIRIKFVDRKLVITNLSIASYVERFTVLQKGSFFSVDVINNLQYPFLFDSYHEIFEWDPEKEQFIAQDYFEKMLFTSDQPQKIISELSDAINHLQSINADKEILGFSISRLQYLLGLAYELSGDRDKAAETYYNLWLTYPDQPYAITSREKLQPINP